MSKKEIKTFSLAFGNLPGNMQPLAKQDIMEGCSWNSPQLFSMKKNGTRALSEKEQFIVDGIMKKYGINAWTGQPEKETV